MIKRIILPLFFLLCLLRAGFAFSQQPDTVVVYEYIYKTDTVWVESAPTRDSSIEYMIQNKMNYEIKSEDLEIDPTLVPINYEKSATISDNSIIIPEDKHSKNTKMKKASFITLFLIALQSITYAQPDVSVKAGVSQFWYKPFTNFGNSRTLGDHQGIEFKGSIFNENVSFAVGFESHGYGKTMNMSTFMDGTNTISNWQYSIIESHRSIPITLSYHYLKFDVFAGYEYRFVKRDIMDQGSETNTSIEYRNEHGLCTGLELELTDRISLLGKLYLGDAFIKNRTTNGEYKIVNGTSLDVSLKYYIYRNKLNQSRYY